MADPHEVVGADLDEGIVAEGLGGRDHVVVAQRHQWLGGDNGERADGRPPQVAEVRSTPERSPQVGGQGADVGARRALDLDAEHARFARGVDVESVHCDRPRLTLDLDPGPGQLVQSFAADLDRRDHRRHLQDLTGQRRRRRADGTEVDATHIPLTRDLTRRIEGGGGSAEHHLARVGLGQIGEVPEQAGDTTEADEQDAGGVGIERARVPHPLLAEAAAELGHDVMRRPPGLFVDDDQPVDHPPWRCERCSRRAALMSSSTAATGSDATNPAA